MTDGQDWLPVAYTVRQSSRAKRLSIVVRDDGQCEVVVPKSRLISEGQVRAFVTQHEGWVVRHVQRAKRREPRLSLTHQGIPKERITTNTRRLVEGFVREACRQYGFIVKGIRVRSYKTRWGSCSNEKHLAFHYKLSLLPRELAEYVMLHELAHTVHFNHSKAFWRYVHSLCPDYKRCKKELRKYVV